MNIRSGRSSGGYACRTIMDGRPASVCVRERIWSSMCLLGHWVAYVQYGSSSPHTVISAEKLLFRLTMSGRKRRKGVRGGRPYSLLPKAMSLRLGIFHRLDSVNSLCLKTFILSVRGSNFCSLSMTPVQRDGSFCPEWLPFFLLLGCR